MGWLDNLNLDDPKTQMLLQMGMGLLGGAPGQRKNFGADLAHAGQQGLLGYAGAKSQQAKLAEEAQQSQLRQVQIAQAQQGQADQQAQRDLAGRAFAPAGGYPGGMTGDDNGNPMPPNPMNPGGGGTAEYLRGLMRINPKEAIQLQGAMAQQGNISKIDPKDYTQDSFRQYLSTFNPGVLVPRTKVELSGGVAYDPYNTKPGNAIAGPQSDVVPDGKGGWTYNTAKINPLDRVRVGMEGQRLRNDNITTYFNTGMGGGAGGPSPQGQGQPLAAPQATAPNQDPLAGLSPKAAMMVRRDLATKAGEAKFAAQQGLPDLAAQTTQTLGLVDKLLTHPGFKTTVGAKGPTGVFAANGYAIPGTDAADFMALKNQVVGQQFMQAYQTLKGGGAITEVEGKKATGAISRMDTAQSEKAFREAANDFRLVLQAGLMRAKARAGGQQATQVQAPRRYNPETGTIE